jgi:predicted DCC family thiol-disulfide oxidoreductase YuxK
MKKFPEHIILFDGVCNLCNGVVKFVSKHDKRKIFHFASLQSETGKFILEKFGLDVNNLDTFVYVRNGQCFTRGNAGLMVLNELGVVWKLKSIMHVLPDKMINFLYNMIAKNRYLIFGKKDHCTMMEIDLDKRFLK